jgi:hypothetical protein
MPFPHIDHCIICDLARPELGGKSTILGFYGIAPNVDIRVQNINLPMIGLTFFFVGGAGAGSGSLSLEVKELLSGSGIISTPPQPIDIRDAQRTIFPFVLSGGLRFPHAGRFVIQLLKDGSQIYRDTFLVSQGDPEEFTQFGQAGGVPIPASSPTPKR